MFTKSRASVVRMLIAPLAVLSLIFAPGTVRAAGPDDAARVMLLLDVSGSMNEKLPSGETRLAAARSALRQVADALPAGTQVGLRVYGSEIAEPKEENPKACRDSKVVMPLGPLDKQKMYAAADSFDAKGETPMAYALEQTVGDLGDSGKRMVVLISDGEENCVPDPCASAKKLADAGVDLQFNAVGFGVNAKAREQLRCIADAGNGSYYDADDAEDLAESIRRLARRALRPFGLNGQPVSGASAPDGAPPLAAGQYLDTIARPGEKKYYRIERSPGGTISAGFAAITAAPTADGMNQDIWGIDLQTPGGDSCDSSSTAQAAYQAAAVVGLGVRSDRTSNPDCAAGPLVLEVSRQAGAFNNDAATDIELMIDDEPAITNLDRLPPPEDGVPQARAVSGGKVEEVDGGTAFSDAPDVGTGSWDDTITVGETRVYRVPLEPGQQLRASLTVPRPGAKNGMATPAEVVTSRIGLFAPGRAALGEGASAVIQAGNAQTVSVATPEIRVRNRESESRTVAAASQGGDYFIAVEVASVGPDQVGRPLDIRLDVAVDGQPDGLPEYAEPVPSAQPSAGTPGESPEGPEASAPGFGFPIWGAVLGGVLLLVAAAGAGLLALRRRR
ncbi:Ca-activated chloride channel family protein [Naumannella cuiyingiana]|uniref:Ca-activated chloride channel family protein n=1 Tax=Naumannella cuiyingiana TaxID=1347891 RepID=A0A7Z0D8W4_9ACTN|nr:Ca-activated chloride channel family protein [Naumannella cuiyingiana]